MRSRAVFHAAFAFRAVVLLLPAVAFGVSVAQQELAAARRSKPDPTRGAELYDTCAACHGPDGAGTRDGQVPRIAGQHASVLMKQLVDFRHDRRWDPRMEHFSDSHHLADAEAIADVAAYISRLGGGYANNGRGNGEQLERGAESYARLCTRCHGASGDGKANRAIPRIAGQQYEYLRRQIYDAVDGRRPNFSRAHIRLFARLDYDDIQAVADYVSRLGTEETEQR